MAMSRAFGGRLFTTRPPIAISPPVMFSSPASIRRSVVLPQPEGPTRTANSASSISTFTPCNTSSRPNDLRTLRMVTVAIGGRYPFPVQFSSCDGRPLPAAEGGGHRISKPGGACLFRGHEFQQSRLALLRLLDAALDRRLDLRGIGDAFAVAAERLRHVGIVAGDVGRTIFLGGDRH